MLARIFKNIILIASLLNMLFLLSHCSSDQQQLQEELNVENEEGYEDDNTGNNANNGNNYSDENGENNYADEGGENNYANEGGEGENGGNYAEEGENLNNATENEYADAGGENLGANNYATDEGEMLNNAGSEDMEEGIVNATNNTELVTNTNIIEGNTMNPNGMVDQIPTATDTQTNSIVDNAVTDTNIATPDDSMAAPQPLETQTVYQPGGIVLYVRKGGATLYNQPGGNAVGTLVQGDHPLVWFVQ